MKHTCHAQNCKVIVKPALLMCSKHWQMVPAPMKQKVYQAYVPGQGLTGTRPTKEYLSAARAAITYVAAKEKS